MTDPFEKYEKKIVDLQAIARENAKSIKASTEFLMEERNENRRLRDACRQTNKGITRLRRRCDSQARTIEMLQQALFSACVFMQRAGVDPDPEFTEFMKSRRPEKAT